MATFRKRGAKWEAQVRRKGMPQATRTFARKCDADLWARQMEAEADRQGLPFDPARLQRLTVGDLLTRYRDTVTIHKRGRVVEAGRLDLMLRHGMAQLRLSQVNGSVFAGYRDQRLQRLKPETVRRELALLQHVFEIARREWAVPIQQNPLTDLRKPPADKARERRLTPEETDRLLNACRQCRNPLVRPFFMFAIHTGMRRGELLNLRWSNVDFDRRTLHIPVTKNGHPRTIPLSPGALDILRGLHSGRPEATQEGLADRVFPLTVEAVKLSWRRLTRRAGVTDLHFHDLRHEAISRFFERGLSVPEVALISGHRDYRMLFRYTHLRPEDVAKKLAI